MIMVIIMIVSSMYVCVYICIYIYIYMFSLLPKWFIKMTELPGAQQHHVHQHGQIVKIKIVGNSDVKTDNIHMFMLHV